VCVENRASGLLKVLGGYPGALVDNWNRSEGVIYMTNGSKVLLDGADDGALRIQGNNLSGAWCDEVGLWKQWDVAWNYSLRPAVRVAPARIIATGTPKMGHQLIGYLLTAPNVAHTHMRTVDNIANLEPGPIADMFQEWEGTTLGRQELEGEYIEALEGEILRREDWRYYDPSWSFYRADGEPVYAKLPRFQQIVHSWDTAVKDKTTADYYSGQVWGVVGADRWLLRLWHEHSGFEQAKQAMRDMYQWSTSVWPRTAVRGIVEAAGLGPDIVKQLEREIQGFRCVPSKGDKVQRVWAASPALESHNCVLPGRSNQTGDGYEATQTPTSVQAFVEECAMFRGDMKHAHDDQVDAWSQMVNWTRGRTGKSSISIPTARVPAVGVLAGIDEW
jgi:predicted phage terminase large subunit-like protein